MSPSRQQVEMPSPGSCARCGAALAPGDPVVEVVLSTSIAGLPIRLHECSDRSACSARMPLPFVKSP